MNDCTSLEPVPINCSKAHVVAAVQVGELVSRLNRDGILCDLLLTLASLREDALDEQNSGSDRWEEDSLGFRIGTDLDDDDVKHSPSIFDDHGLFSSTNMDEHMIDRSWSSAVTAVTASTTATAATAATTSTAATAAAMPTAPTAAKMESDESINNNRATLSCATFDASWEDRFSELKRYHAEHGDCLVPYSWPANQSLAEWVKRMRYQYNRLKKGCYSTLTPDRVEALENLGFVWSLHRRVWDEKYDELVLFTQEHGHCRVPNLYADNPSLAHWLKTQRRHYRKLMRGEKNPMTDERLRRLNLLGFQKTIIPGKHRFA